MDERKILDNALLAIQTGCTLRLFSEANLAYSVPLLKLQKIKIKKTWAVSKHFATFYIPFVWGVSLNTEILSDIFQSTFVFPNLIARCSSLLTSFLLAAFSYSRDIF